MTFKNLDLNDALLKAVDDLGFVEPTPIQAEGIPEMMSGDRDLVGLAQTGTGKTAAFGLSMIQLIDFGLIHTQGVVICPTRELCMQIAKDIQSFCKYIKTARIAAVYGGVGIENQIHRIKKGVQIIVATPGRLLDLMHRSVINLSHMNYCVLDEADEMLTMGFQEDIDAILEQTPAEKRIWLFSAAMPREVATIAKKYMHRPVEITIGKKNAGAENIEHIYFVVRESNRYPALKRIIDFHPDIYGLVFCRTRKETQEIAEKLINDGYNAEALHGDLSQQVREQVMGRYRAKSIRVLIATDVAARGIDVQDITHVINYRLPDEPDDYTHRSGRTGRAGKSGMAIAIINSKENYKLQQIERKSGIKFACAKVPEGRAVCENQLYAMINKLVAVEVNHAEIGKFLPPVYGALSGLTKEALIQKFVSLEFNRFLDDHRFSR
jgi:ATP-dependent RNA helicase DeaD